MDEYVKVVNKIAASLQRFLAENPNHTDYQKRESELLAIKKVLEYVDEQITRNQPVDSELGDLSDLPKELRDELHLYGPSELEQRIVAIVRKSEDQKANINTILVELFRRHGVTLKRRNIQNKLSRMMGNDLLIGVEGQKGTYTIPKPVTDPSDLPDEDPFASPLDEQTKQQMLDDMPF